MLLLSPRHVVEKWVSAFNAADIATLESLYAKDAVNHQMPNEPVAGREAIGEMFRHEFAAAPEMHCIPVQIIEEGNWAVLEWIQRLRIFRDIRWPHPHTAWLLG
jgi:ketosteroid isomerase-like protein